MKKILISIIIIISAFPVGNAQKQPVIFLADTTQIGNLELNEVIVTAEKREEKLIEVPYAVSLISARKAEQEKIETLRDLTSRVPNLFMPDYGSRLTAPIYIRGIGSRRNTPSIGLYVDNIPYFEKSSFVFDFNDIERVEVLRGPQGTLYGRNTMGGLIHVITRRPSAERDTRLSTEIGNYGNLKLNGYHSQALFSDDLLFSASAGATRHDGFHHNEFLDQRVDNLEDYVGKLKVSYNVSGKLQFKLMAHDNYTKQGGYPYAVFNNESRQIENVSYNHRSIYERNHGGVSLNATYKGRWFTLNTTGSFQNQKDLQDVDQDFTSFSYVAVQQYETQDLYTHEVRLTSEYSDRFHWVMGIFGFTQSLDKQVDVGYGEDGISRFKLPGPMEKMKYYDEKNHGIAGYFQTTWKEFLVNNLDLTLGGRLDLEDNSMKYSYDLDMMGNVRTMDDTLLKREPVLVPLPKLSLKYNFSDKSNVYASFAGGYKNGGFNTTIEEGVNYTFDPEKSFNYEVGMKSSVLQNKLQFNLALYYIDWKDQQIDQPVPSGQGAQTTNAGHSRSYGFELEAAANPLRNLITSVSFGYNEATFLDYVEDSTTDYSGNYIPYVPKFTGNLSVSYRIPFKSKTFQSLVLHSNYQQTGKLFWDEANSAYHDSYGIINASALVDLGMFDIEFWGRNILGTEYHSFWFDMTTAFGNEYAQQGKPFNFGATVRVKF